MDIEPTPTTAGYWLLTADGRVSPYGDATALGNLDTGRLSAGEQVTSLSSGTPTGKGYRVFTSRGRAVAFGDATFLGDVFRLTLNGPVLDSVATPSGKGYYMVASDGGIFAFGAPFEGSMGSTKLSQPITGMVRYGDGYLMVGEDGGIFDFSSSPFAGSLGGHPGAADRAGGLSGLSLAQEPPAWSPGGEARRIRVSSDLSR